MAELQELPVQDLLVPEGGGKGGYCYLALSMGRIAVTS